MYKVSTLFALFGFSTLVFANQTGTDYQNDQGTVDSHRGSIVSSAQSFNPGANYPAYNPNPSQTSYYQGVAVNDSNIEQQGAAQLENDKAGGTVFNHFIDRPKIKINQDSPDFDDSNLVKSDSYNISHGISDQYIDCKKHETCKIVNQTHTCNRTNTIQIGCTRTPKVNIEVEPFTKPVPNPCTHIVVLNAQSSIPQGAKTLASFSETKGFWNSTKYNVYQVPGQSKDTACYLPMSLHVEHDRNQHGTSQVQVFASAMYLFYAQAVYVDHWGVGDLHIKENGQVVGHVQSDSNTGPHSTYIVAAKDSTYVLDGTNWGFDGDDFANAYSIYWAATPLKQTHKAAKVTWSEDCGGNSHA